MSTNFSYWEQTAFIKKADVVIIGSGLVGLSAALHLKHQQPQLKVLVLERGFLPSGASTKNAGFACFGTVSEQISFIKRSGEAEMQRMVDYKWRGLQRLRQNLGDANIDYQQHGGYELFLEHETNHAGKIIDQLEYINQLLKDIIGHSGIYSVKNDKIAEFGFKRVTQLVYNPYEGQIHTGLMMRALLQKVYNLGVLILNDCDITATHQEEDGVCIESARGSFTARQVILATNAFAKQLYPDLEVTPGRGQVIVTEPISNLKLKGTYHFDDGYYYFRNIDNRILFGGGRNLDFSAEATWEFGQTPLVQQKLSQYLNDVILPDQPVKIDYQWSGIMGFGEDINPIIKQLQPRIFCAVRCNGMGVAMGSLVGEEVSELVLRSGV